MPSGGGGGGGSGGEGGGGGGGGGAAVAGDATAAAALRDLSEKGYLQHENFDAGSDAFATFRMLLVAPANREHVRNFLKPADEAAPAESQAAIAEPGSGGAGGGGEVAAAAAAAAPSGGFYAEFFARFTVLLQPAYMTNFMVSLQSLKLLADIILEPKNFKIMIKFIGVSAVRLASSFTPSRRRRRRRRRRCCRRCRPTRETHRPLLTPPPADPAPHSRRRT